MDPELAEILCKQIVDEIIIKNEEFNAPPPPPVWESDPHYRFLIHTGGSWFYVEHYNAVPEDWLDNNLEGRWRHFDELYYFEKESDLTLFTLRWR